MCVVKCTYVLLEHCDDCFMFQTVEDAIKDSFAQNQIWLRGTLETNAEYMLLCNYKDNWNDWGEERDYDG